MMGVYAKDGLYQTDRNIYKAVMYGDFLTAWWTVSKFITKRELEKVHKNIMLNIALNPYTLDLAPRGFGKSTIGDVDYCITKILRNPDIRILIGSKTQMQAEAFVKEVRTHLEQNDDLIRIFGEMVGYPWKDKEFTVKKRKHIKKEATLTALGASGAVISKHFDIIIADDLVGFENARTETQREKLKEWFYSSLLPTLEPEGELHVLGTRYNPLDLYEDLIKSGNYRVQIQRAIQQDGKSLWEKKFSIKKLRQIEAESGKIIFSMQYQNETELAKGSIFKYKYFKYYDDYEIDRSGNVYVSYTDNNGKKFKKPVTVYFGVDLAIEQKETDDFYVLMVIGIDDEKNVFVLDYIRERLTFNQQLNTVLRYADKFPGVERIGIEANAYQAAMVQELKRQTLLPVVGLKTVKDKVTRAMRRSAIFENGKVYFRTNMGNFEEELLLFPEVDHDDRFDAFDFACQASEKSRVRVLDRSEFSV